MWATRILANPYISLANKIAPIISATILLGYSLGGRRVNVINPAELSLENACVVQKCVQEKETLPPKQAYSAYVFANIGGG